MIIRTLTAPSEKAYDEAIAYIGEISCKVENINGHLVYRIAKKLGGGLVVPERDVRAIELRNINEDTEGLIKHILDTEIRSF